MQIFKKIIFIFLFMAIAFLGALILPQTVAAVCGESLSYSKIRSCFYIDSGWYLYNDESTPDLQCEPNQEVVWENFIEDRDSNCYFSATGSCQSTDACQSYHQTPQFITYSGTVYADNNENGELDTGDEVKSGVTVILWEFTDSTVSGDPQLRTKKSETTTGGDGTYRFDVTQGNYDLELVVPEGYSVTTANPIGTLLEGGVVDFPLAPPPPSSGYGPYYGPYYSVVNRIGFCDYDNSPCATHHFGNSCVGYSLRPPCDHLRICPDTGNTCRTNIMNNIHAICVETNIERSFSGKIIRDHTGECTDSTGGHIAGFQFYIPPPPNCDSGISCVGSCNAAPNTCGPNNGTFSNCQYTTYSGGGSCNAVPAPDDPCTVNCSSGLTCVAGACIIPTVTIQGHYVDQDSNPVASNGRTITISGGSLSSPTTAVNDLSPNNLWKKDSLSSSTNSFTVTPSTLSGYTISYATCTNGTTCTRNYTQATSTTVNLPNNSDYADIYFKYTPIATSTVTIQGQNVDADGNPLAINIGQKISITGPTNGTRTGSTHLGAWDFTGIPAGTYTVTATVPTGYLVSYSYSGKNISPPVASYVSNNSVSVTLPDNGNYADIYFKYTIASCDCNLSACDGHACMTIDAEWGFCLYDIGYGECIVPTYSISGKIFNDPNRTAISTGTGTSNYNSGVFSVSSTGGNIVKPAPGGNAGSYQISGLPAGQYTVTFSGPLSANYNFTYPFPNPVDRSLNVTVGQSCSASGLESSCSGGNIVNLNAGVTNIQPAWFQSVGSDMRWDSGFTDILPSAGKYASVPAASGRMPGIIFSGLNSPVLGEADRKASEKNWQVSGDFFTTSHSLIPTSYNFLMETANSSGITPQTITSLDQITAHGIYVVEDTGHTEKDLNVNSDFAFPSAPSPACPASPAPCNFIILVHGNLNINANITVPVGSTAIFSASGNITVDPSVTQIDGLYSADGTFTVEGSGCGSQMKVYGSVIANAIRRGGTFINHRDLCGGNSSNPSVSFVERPDFMLNYPSFVSQIPRSWQEVAP